MANIKILVVEDDMITAADISLQLTQAGYEVSGITPRGEDALKSIESTRPDLVLMDVHLKGALDGVETARQVTEQYGIPLIFLTANSDAATYNRAKTARPFAFISKPFQPVDLERAIELAFERATGGSTSEPTAELSEQPFLLDDRIFVRHHDRMVKVLFHEVLFVEAERSYCKIFADDKEYLLAVPLGTLEEKLPRQYFMRVHRSFIVNLSRVDALSEQQESLIFGKLQVPLSRSFRDEVVARLRLV